VKMASMGRLERLIELARAAERLAQDVERVLGTRARKDYNEDRNERASLPDTPSRNLIQSPNQTERHQIHYQNQGVYKAIAPCAVGHLTESCPLRTHATPTSTSSETPVSAISRFASSPLTNRSRRSNREYAFCEIASRSAASRCDSS